MITSYRSLHKILFLALGLLQFDSAQAASQESFYSGKRVSVIVGYSAGGGYDLYARTVTRHMGRHIPGNPSFIVQNMPGAGSRKAANWLYQVAPKDGTSIGAVGENTPLDQILGGKGIQFDPAKFNWIGNANIDNNILYARADAGYETVNDIRERGGLICGGTGATSPSILNPQLLNNLLNLRIRSIVGYRGSSDVNIALERGEVNCRGSNSWGSTKATQANALRQRSINILVQFGPKSDPTISKYQGRRVPLITELASNEEDRRALELIVSGVGIGRSLLAPPNVSFKRIQGLRESFMKTMSDRKFLQDAEKQKMDVNPNSGEAVEKIVLQMIAAAPRTVLRAKELLRIRRIEAK